MKVERIDYSNKRYTDTWRGILAKHKADAEYAEYLYREESDFTNELMRYLEECLPYLPSEKNELREKIQHYVNAFNV